MPVTIDATAGGASANSFVTLTEAQAYADGRLNESLWEAATTDKKNRALVEATRELSAKTWQGQRTTTTQALSWPRAWAPNPDIVFAGTPFFDSTIIPQRIKDATCELALQFIKAGSTDIAALDPTISVTEKTVGPLTTRYAEPYARARGLARFPSVIRYIRPMLSGLSNSAEVIRG